MIVYHRPPYLINLSLFTKYRCLKNCTISTCYINSFFNFWKACRVRLGREPGPGFYITSPGLGFYKRSVIAADICEYPSIAVVLLPLKIDVLVSPADTAFWLHYGMVDRVWWTWQTLDLKNRLYAISGTGTFMSLPVSPNTTLSTMIDLGYANRGSVAI
jgi:hypothetical protein